MASVSVSLSATELLILSLVGLLFFMWHSSRFDRPRLIALHAFGIRAHIGAIPPSEISSTHEWSYTDSAWNNGWEGNQDGWGN